MSTMSASIRLHLAGRAAVLTLLVALAGVAGSFPAAAQVNPFGKQGGNKTTDGSWKYL